MAKKKETPAGDARVVLAVPADLAAKARELASQLGMPSVGALALELLANYVRGKPVKKRTGRIPDSFFDYRGPLDPTPSVRRAVQEERESGW